MFDISLQFCLTISGLLCIGGAFIIAVGVCSMLGISYGPVHTSLPFLLMGLGVDDIFIMMASWEQIHSYEDNRRKSLEEKVGLMLSHAGSAICITSLTDVVAFIIGASTVRFFFFTDVEISVDINSKKKIFFVNFRYYRL